MIGIQSMLTFDIMKKSKLLKLVREQSISVMLHLRC